MSPLLQNRNVPLIRPRKGGRIGAGGDEPGGIAESRSAEPSKERAVASSGCGAAAARELPTSEAVVEALSRGRCWGPAASQRGASLQPCPPVEVSAAGARSGIGEVRWAGGEAFWANADGRALGSRRWTAGECRDAAAVDAGSGAMEPGTEAAEAPQEARAEGAFWGTGADGRQLSRVVGRARSGWLFDRYGGRRDEYHVGAVRRAGNDLGGGRCFARMDRAIRSTAG